MYSEMDAKVARQPSPTDPAEKRIRQLLDQEMLTTDWARSSLAQARDIQEKFLLESLDLVRVGKKDQIRTAYQNTINELARTLNPKIVSGEEHLDALKGKPAIIVTNHLGTAKATRISNNNIFPGLEVEPFPIRHFAFQLIADRTGGQLHEIALELPGALQEVQKSSGVLTIPVEGSGRTQLLIDNMNDEIKSGNPIFVIYPEGGTTGKRNGKGLYDLEQFHAGAFVAGANLGISVLPVGQYLNPNGGLELYVLPPLQPNDDAHQTAESARSQIQEALPVHG